MGGHRDSGAGFAARRRTSPPSGSPRAITSRQAVKAVVMARKQRRAPKYAGALAQPNMRTEAAIRKLKENKFGRWGRHSVENLGARYREAKRHQEQFRKLVEAARELRARGQTLDGLLSLLPPTKISARAKTSRKRRGF